MHQPYKPWSRSRSKNEKEAQTQAQAQAFYSHMDVLLTRLGEWPELMQSSLSLHPTASQDFLDVAEPALVDLRFAVNTFHEALMNADAGFSNAGYGRPEHQQSGPTGIAATRVSSVGSRPALSSQRTTMAITDVMSEENAEQWKRDHNSQKSFGGEEIELGVLNIGDKKWQKCCPDGVLNPQAPFRRRWDNAVGLLVMVDVLIVPFQLAYMSTVPVTFFMCVWPWILTVFFTVDMVLNLRTAFASGPTDHHRPGMLVTDKAKIARRYIYSRAFLVDLITTIPWSQAIVHIRVWTHWTGKWERRIVAATAFVRLVRMLRLQKLLLVWQRIEDGASSVLQLHTLVLLRTLATMWIFCHLNACWWFMVGKRDHELTQLFPHSVRDHFNELPHWTEVDRGGWTWETVPIFNQYAFSFYWTLGVMRTMPSEVLPANVYERVYVMLLMFAAFSLFAISVAQVTQTFTKFTERKRAFNEELLALQLYMDSIGAPKTLQNDVVNYSKHLFDHRRVNAKESGLMARLPPSLTKDLHNVQVESYIRRLATFEHWRQRALSKVSAVSEIRHVSRGTVLSQRGKPAVGTWILMAGHLEVFRHHQDTVGSSREIIEVVDEDCLGTDEPWPSPLTIISSASAEVLFIPKARFLELVESLSGEHGFNMFSGDPVEDEHARCFETPGVPNPFDKMGPEKPLLSQLTETIPLHFISVK